MVVLSLKVKNYRNISSLQFEPSPGINVFHGENGSGKTNLLESIFNLCLGRSQRGATDSTVMKSGEAYYRLEGEIETGGKTRTIAVACEHQSRKRVQINGINSKLSELFRLSCVVAAGPEDSRIIAGSPSDRRGFLDMYLSQLSSTYLDDLSSYQKALAQKNAALKKGMEPGLFDDLLVTSGCRLIINRGRFISKLAKYAVNSYREIAGGESLKIEYMPSIPLPDYSDGSDEQMAGLRESFVNLLDQKKEREQALRVAVVGPHRDDIRFEISGYPARTHGSQGQWRSAAIALKLGMYHLLKEEKDQSPILLLDEIFAELDSRRAVQLMHMFSEFSQLFVTMAMSPPVSIREAARCYKVTAGKIVEVV